MIVKSAPYVILSHFHSKPLLELRDSDQPHAKASPDLGLTMVEITITLQGVEFPSGETLSWDAIEEISSSEASCFVIEGGKPRKVLTFSELTNRSYSLMPTHRAPTMLVSGVPMHRIKGTEPHSDTLEKIKAIRPVVGRVLDTATGLGYTAIQAARTAEQVITVELDPAALEIARLNPWSRALFDNPKIAQRIGDSFDVVQEFEDESFTRIIHDPPELALAGHLYSGEFYRQLRRVLRRGGRLFHYVGNPESRSGGTVMRGVVRRLQESGFARVRRCPQAFGVVALK
jgi:hypothetical protein